MPRQRWYGTKGRAPVLRIIADWHLTGIDAHLLLVHDTAARPAVLYQVPLARRPAADAPATSVVGDAGDGLVWTDAATDPAFTAELYRWVTLGGSVDSPSGTVTGRPLAAADDASAAPSATARVLSGEQSNTSIIFRPDGHGIPVICKLFRRVNPGTNPDVELQSALAAGGAAFVPAAVGEVSGTWTSVDGLPTSGSLAFAQEFFEGVEDAWRVALRAAARHDDFAARARALGESVGRMHLALAQTFATRTPTPDDRSAVAAAWERRLGIAVAEVPALAPYAARIRAVYAAAVDAPWPDLQRVHGDLHLGQVLDTAANGWVLLDFEGEPLRPISERLQPDVAVRDVAGMLRSFDYVSGAVTDVDPGSVREWVIAAQDAFLAGYTGAVGAERAGSPHLLAAFELDKAVYETIYETRNRPDWVGIPLSAIRRLVDAPEQ